MAKKEKKIVSVITMPLVTEKWQEDILFKRFEVCRKIYNAMLGQMLKKYRMMTDLKEYKAASSVINAAYKEANGNDRELKRIKSTPEYKEATETQNRLRMEYGFTEFQFGKASLRYSEYFRDIIPTKLAQMSIGKPLWAAFEMMLFNKGEGKRPAPHFKKYDSFSSVVTDGRSGIRIVDENDKTILKMDPAKRYWVYVTTKKSKNLKMPIKVDKKNLYLLEMMDRDIHTVRIIRKKVRGNYRYLVQLTVSGVPAEKLDRDGNRKHSVGYDKEVGVYINTRSVTLATKEGTRVIDLRNPNKYEDRIADIQRYMDNSKRATNPGNYNPDGTAKKKTRWNFSKGYQKARAEKANLERVMAEQRKIRANMIANEIIALGTNIVVNDYSFAKAAERKKEDEKTKRGTCASKKKAGKAISENAPSMIITILDNKLKALGYNGVVKERVEELEPQKPGLNEFYALQMLAKCCG